MDGNHPENVDRRPKRRRDKDNPYELFTVGIDTAHPRYFLTFTDSGGTKRCVEIDRTLYEAFDGFELDDLSFLNEVDRHYEQSDQTEASLNRRAFQPPESVEETVAHRLEVDKLHRAIGRLPGSGAGWSCTISESLHTSRSRKWRDALFKSSQGLSRRRKAARAA